MRTLAVTFFALILQSFSVSTHSALSAPQQEALVALYGSTNGASWTNNTNWLVGDPCENEWHGIICDDADTFVGGLWLWSNNLDGQIPPELGNLTSLRGFYLENNQLSGSIPPELGNLTLLVEMKLQNNQLNGSIPPELGSLTHLQTLDFENNQLTGPIPPELGNMQTLQILSVRYNQITGPIPPELGTLAELFLMYLDNNQLSGSIPPELGGLSRLYRMYLFNNELTGTIPPELGNLSGLESLDLSGNSLSGSIPPDLSNLGSLKYLSLIGNQLSGPIPAELGGMGNLEGLSLDVNQLTGEIPPEFALLNKLKGLGLSLNQLTGSIPSFLGDLTNLKGLLLSGNQFTGTIPPELGNLYGLFSLYLKDNQLTGVIPAELGNLSGLTRLSIGNNQLSGSIPSELGNLANLLFLELGNNHLSGEIPPELGRLESLVELDLSDNRLVGTIPPELGNLVGLDWIHLSSNQLEGPIPAELMNLTNLELYGLWLRWNKLYTQEPDVQAFMDVHANPNWHLAQTVAPPNVHVSGTGQDFVTVSWDIDAIATHMWGYDIDQRYRVWYSTSLGGPYLDGGFAPHKADSSHTVTDLLPDAAYYFVVQTETYRHAFNKSDLISEFSPVVSASTSSGGGFSVGGDVLGLSGTNLVLRNNGGDELVINAKGQFSFATPLANGSGYSVTIETQPSNPAETCSVIGGSGTITGASITNISVLCPIESYMIGGAVSGLSGAGLVLQNNNADDLGISENGVFSFVEPVDEGSPYNVTVQSKPTNPSQTCEILNSTGEVGNDDITDVLVTCETDTFTVGGTVNGLAGEGLVLQNNGDDDFPIGADGGFTFTTRLDDGSGYDVTVLSQPTNPGQTCTVGNGNGELAGANVTDVTITCITDTFTVGGHVAGLEGSGLVLQNNGDDELPIEANGAFTFVTQLDDGTNYDVTVLVQPIDPSQTCTISNGNGALAGADVIDVTVTCVTDQLTVGGNVTGLEGTGLVLQNNGSDDLPILSSGGFIFATQLEYGSSYSVTVLTQPNDPAQECTVSNSSGTDVTANVTNVWVHCITNDPARIFMNGFEG